MLSKKQYLRLKKYQNRVLNRLKKNLQVAKCNRQWQIYIAEQIYIYKKSINILTKTYKK